MVGQSGWDQPVPCHAFALRFRTALNFNALFERHGSCYADGAGGDERAMTPSEQGVRTPQTAPNPTS